MQLDLLWKFMQVDMEADRFEAEMRQAPNRQKLLKNRAFLVDQQNNMKRIETEIATMSDRMAALEDEIKRLEGQAENLSKAFSEHPPEAREEIDKLTQQAQKLMDTLNHYEQELAKMRKDAETRDRQQREIRVRAAKAKAEYDQVKMVYDGEFKRDSAKLKELRDNAETAGKGIEPVLMEKYKTIKQHTAVPMAQMNGDQCGGCFMALPEVVLRNIRSGERVVECDNCGRILYIPSESAQ